MPYSDTHREPVTAKIIVGGKDVSNYAVFRRCSFEAVAAAQPGTAQVILRDPNDELSFTPGNLMQLKLNGEMSWQGYLTTVEQGYFLADKTEKSWSLQGVDLNILFDRLVLYNHSNPIERPDGGNAYKTVKGVVTVPQHTMDRDYILNMLEDTDLYLMKPTIKYRISEIAQINPDGKFTPPDAGVSLRAFFQDVAANVQKGEPGSVIFYISPDGYLIYKAQDQENAPFSVGDDGTGVNVRDLSITTDISRIKNDVIIFTGNLDPRPGSVQQYLLYRHLERDSSIAKYGRFQYSEVLPAWSQRALNARARKIIYQEGDPAKKCEFTIFRSGLRPGMIVNVSSTAHGVLENFPIRSITMSFPTADIVEYRVMCSYDTQDPWGLLLALKRPPVRGLVQPRFNSIDLTKNPDLDPPSVETYTFVREYPSAIGGNVYQCSYGYIRYSLAVFYGGLRQTGLNDAGTVGFLETSPDKGQFKLGFTPSSSKRVYVEYHVSKNLGEQ